MMMVVIMIEVFLFRVYIDDFVVIPVIVVHKIRDDNDGHDNNA